MFTFIKNNFFCATHSTASKKQRHLWKKQNITWWKCLFHAAVIKLRAFQLGATNMCATLESDTQPHTQFYNIKAIIFNFPRKKKHFTEATNSLRLSKLVVPSIKYRGENAQLECQYELNNRSVNYHQNNNNNNLNAGYESTNGRNNGYRRNNYLYYDNDEDMEETLYSVKWYKDEEEFYRYVPRANPPQNSYNFDGIKVDVSWMVKILWTEFLTNTFFPHFPTRSTNEAIATKSFCETFR